MRASDETSSKTPTAQIRDRYGLQSVRWKIAGVLALVVLGITGLDAWLVPARAAEAERDSLRQRGSATAAMIAEAVMAAVEFEQEDSAQETLKVVLADPLVAWAGIYRPNGSRMAMVGKGAPNKLSAAKAHTGGQVIARHAAIGKATNALGHVVIGVRTGVVEQRRQSTRQAITLQGAIVGAIGLLLALFLATRIARSVTKMAEAAEQIARGDVGADLQLPRSQDELGDMAMSFEYMNNRLRLLQHTARRVAEGDLAASDIDGDGELFAAFRQMVENLRSLTVRIGDSSEEVSSAAAGMFAAVREQESLATQQTASIEEIRRTLEALTVAAETVAQDATAVREMSHRTLESSQRMAEHIRLVSAHSDRIGEILSLIQDIADRSDLLALNAALEGTKAGEVGRGFSLVAAEMRRLSEHVMDSVRDIRRLVADMRSASHSSVLATEESTKLAKDAASAATKISDAVQRQQEGTSQAKSAADEVVRAVNNSLAGSAQTTRSAESLLELSHQLKQTISAFQVSSNHSAQ